MLSIFAQVEAAQSAVNSDVVANLISFLKTEGPALGLRVLGAIVILIIGRIVANAVRKGVKKVMLARGVDASLTGFVGSLAYFGIMAFTLVATIGQFGIEIGRASCRERV